MNFSLTPHLETFLRKRTESGNNIKNNAEVVREAIRLVKRIEEEHAFKLEQLRVSTPVGDKAIELGQSNVFNSEEELDQFFAKL